MMYLNFADYLPEDVLAKVDRASMAVGLEVRCPLLDRECHRVRLVVAGGHAISAQTEGNRSCAVCSSRYVPRELTERPKMGFWGASRRLIQGPCGKWAE